MQEFIERSQNGFTEKRLYDKLYIWAAFQGKEKTYWAPGHTSDWPIGVGYQALLPLFNKGKFSFTSLPLQAPLVMLVWQIWGIVCPRIRRTRQICAVYIDIWLQWIWMFGDLRFPVGWGGTHSCPTMIVAWSPHMKSILQSTKLPSSQPPLLMISTKKAQLNIWNLFLNQVDFSLCLAFMTKMKKQRFIFLTW